MGGVSDLNRKLQPFGLAFGVLPTTEAAMNLGKTLFAQVMDFLPWTTFLASCIATAAIAAYAASVVPSSFASWPSRS